MAYLIAARWVMEAPTGQRFCVVRIRSWVQHPTSGLEPAASVIHPRAAARRNLLMAYLIAARWVMEAPTGQRFCVVRMKHPELGAAPNEWP